MRSPLDRSRIMRRAWQIFRETYDYPAVPFRSLGRACLGWAIKAAWAEHREIVALAAHGVETLKVWLAQNEQPVHRVGLSTSFGGSRDLVARARRGVTIKAALDMAEAHSFAMAL